MSWDERPLRDRWAAAMKIARRQLGLFTLEDAGRYGICRQVLDMRVRDKRLVRLFPGVFAVAGSPESWERSALAAQLAGGEHAVLCGEAAGYLHTLLDIPRGPIELVFPRGKLRRLRGVRTRESRRLTSSDIVRVGRHRVTAVEWTLGDLSAVHGERWTERAFYDAWRRGLTDPERIRQHLTAHARNPGGPVLRAILGRVEPSFARAMSPAEVKGLLELRERGVPMPEVNHLVEVGGRRRYIDLAWPLVKLAVEIDGRLTHSIIVDIASDRARQADLEAAGWEVIRIPASWLARDPQRAADRILEALDRLGHPAVA